MAWAMTRKVGPTCELQTLLELQKGVLRGNPEDCGLNSCPVPCGCGEQPLKTALLQEASRPFRACQASSASRRPAARPQPPAGATVFASSPHPSSRAAEHVVPEFLVHAGRCAERRDQELRYELVPPVLEVRKPRRLADLRESDHALVARLCPQARDRRAAVMAGSRPDEVLLSRSAVLV